MSANGDGVVDLGIPTTPVAQESPVQEDLENLYAAILQIQRHLTDNPVVIPQPALVLIAHQEASNSATIDFSAISNDVYSSYVLVCDRVIPTTNATSLRLQVSKGGVWDTTLGNYTHNDWRFTASGQGVDGSTSDSSAALSGAAETLGTGGSQSFSGTFNISNCLQTSTDQHWYGQYSLLASSGLRIVGVNGGAINAGSARDGFRLKMSSGNISSGTFTLYGLRKT